MGVQLLQVGTLPFLRCEMCRGRRRTLEVHDGAVVGRLEPGGGAGGGGGAEPEGHVAGGNRNLCSEVIRASFRAMVAVRAGLGRWWLGSVHSS